LKKAALIALAIVSLSLSALAEDFQTLVVGPFGTLNNTDNPFAIPANKAQDLLNVDITPDGKSVKKREGYGVAHTLTITTSPVHGVYDFFDAGGNEISLYFNDRYLSASSNGGSPAVIFSTGSNGATYQCVDSQGFAYCLNTARTSLFRTNGVIGQVITTVNSTGTMVAVTPERLVTAGFEEAPNRIDFSKANDFTVWTVGGQPTDPVQFTITAPGSEVTHITYAFNRLMWFKDSSFGYILFGPALADWTVQTVSPNVGTLDNTSVYRDGLLYFKGQDAHIYVFDGANFSKLSRDIQGTVEASQARQAGSWLQDTASDFSGGYSLGVDTTTTPGQISLNYYQDIFSSTSGWSGSSPWSVTSGKTHPTVAQACGYKFIVTTQTLTIADHYRLSSTVDFVRNVSTHQYTADAGFLTSSGDGYSAAIAVTDGADTTESQVIIRKWTSNSPSDISTTTITAVSSGTSYILYFSVSATGYMEASVDGVVYVSSTVPSPYTGFSKGFIGTGNVGSGAGACQSPLVSYARFDDYKIRAATGTYQSAVKNAPNITTWDAFETATQSFGATHSFYIRAATGAFSVTSSTPSWTAINSGAVPSISTGSYFQIRDDIAITSPPQAPTLEEFTVNWFEGTASDKSYATYHDDAIWWSVTSGQDATENNKILRYDLLNQGFTLYGFGTNGFFVRNQSLYFGGSESGYIFKFGSVDSDNGEAIEAYWKSKDFFADSPFVEKNLVNLSVAADAVVGSSMTVTYTIDGSSASAYVMPLSRGQSSYSVYNRNLPLGVTGKTFSLQVGNDATDQPFEVFAAQVGYRRKDWIVTP
jgi:hypothetical protein